MKVNMVILSNMKLCSFVNKVIKYELYKICDCYLNFECLGDNWNLSLVLVSKIKLSLGAIVERDHTGQGIGDVARNSQNNERLRVSFNPCSILLLLINHNNARFAVAGLARKLHRNIRMGFHAK